MDIDVETLRAMRGHFEAISEIPDEEWRFATMQMGRKHFRAGDTLIEAGKPVDQQFFILSGLLAYVYATRQGEIVREFAIDGELAGSLSAASSEEPCRFSVIAVEDSDTVAIPVFLLKTLYRRHRVWEHIGRILLERRAAKTEFLEAQAILDNAETRYRRFKLDHPELAERLPLRYVAGYIRVDESTIRRLEAEDDATT